MSRARDTACVSLVLLVMCAGAGGALGGEAHADSTHSIPPATERHFWLPAASDTGWLARDKRLHATVSAALYCALRLATDDPALAGAGAAGAGAAKELHDSWMRPVGPRQGASWRDLVADAAGILAAAALWSALD